MERTRWYKDAVFYQIWPRSFKDGNGDGIGDLWGVLEKLDYIASLGVTGIWFSPLYPSPNADYGYDIADYRSINSEYGDLEVFKQVLDGAHERGLKVIMDLVVNHTSVEHPWFKESRASKDSPYHDYYIWRKGTVKDGIPAPPNNWDSLFEGRAWEYEPALDEWYLHIFAKGQPDLNMDNPAVRAEVEGIMHFWLDMGVDGFREDVITFISKVEGLPNDYLMVPGARGMRFYDNGPRLHECLSQFRRVLDGYDCMAVGEAPMITPHKALPFIEEGPDQTLDMMFNFEHMGADCLFTDFVPMPFSLRRYKDALSRWQRELDGRAWNALYIENHDHPRIASRRGRRSAWSTRTSRPSTRCPTSRRGTSTATASPRATAPRRPWRSSTARRAIMPARPYSGVRSPMRDSARPTWTRGSPRTPTIPRSTWRATRAIRIRCSTSTARRSRCAVSFPWCATAATASSSARAMCTTSTCARTRTRSCS